MTGISGENFRNFSALNSATEKSAVLQPPERYDSSGTSNKVSLHADERGSIVALTYGSPYAPTINRYDEYGRPQSGNVGRFQYTGQMWMSEAGLYHYKARAYFPGLGIFAQTDPIRYAGSPNLYAYVVNDPVNLADPLGLQDSNGEDNNGDDKNQPVDCGGPGIIICANRGSADPASSPAADYLGLGYGFASNEAEILANLAQNTVTVKLPPARPARPTPKPPKPPAPPTPKPPKTISQCEAYSKLGTGLGYAGIMNGAAGVALSATGVGAPVGAILNGIGLVEGLAGGALVVYGDIFCEAG